MGLSAFNRLREKQAKKGGAKAPPATNANSFLLQLREMKKKARKASEPEAPTVDEIRDAIPGLSLEELHDLLEQEQAGKNRKTAVAAIEAGIADLSDEGPADEDQDKGEDEKADPDPDEES